LEHCDDESTQSAMMEEIMQSVVPLTQDQYGNYVIQVGAYSFVCLIFFFETSISLAPIIIMGEICYVVGFIFSQVGSYSLII
jgi:hypothetical protein